MKLRLLLFAACSAAISLMAQQSSTIVGPWALAKKTSLMDDKETVGIVSTASTFDGGFSQKPSLVVGCTHSNRSLQFSVVLHDELVKIEPPNDFQHRPHTDVRLRHDKETAYSRYGFRDGSVIFIEAKNKKLFEALGHTSTLAIELRFASGTVGVAVFLVDHFAEAIAPVAEVCK
jgi:hypothetical protein